METLVKIFGVVVPTFFTSTGGVSLSEINRIQAEHKQKNDEFWSCVNEACEGIFRKELLYVGAGDSTARTLNTTTITPDGFSDYVGVAERNAQTSSLMHAVKLHKRLQEELKNKDLQLLVVEALPEAPERPEESEPGSSCSTDRFMELGTIDEMVANLNPSVLQKFDFAFWKQANELNSRAAVLGKLLSEEGSFFRAIIKPLPKDSEKTLQSGVVITAWKRAYGPESVAEFNALREKLQSEYNDLQKQLNSCKKQVKDALRAYNLDVELQYQTAYGLYRVATEKYNLEMERIRIAAETLRQQAQQELANLRVRVE